MAASKSKSNIENLNYEELKILHETGEGVNYKELCKRLGIPELGGDSKKKQLRELTGIMKFDREGHKYIITELCSHEVLDMFNKRSIYTPYIQLLLTDIFVKNGKDNLYFTTKDMVQKLGIVNENYMAVIRGDVYDNCGIVANKYNYNRSSFYRYMNTSYNEILKNMIRNALTSMVNNRAIDLTTGYCMVKKEKLFGVERYIQDYTNVTEETGDILFGIEGDIMQELGIKDTGELYGTKVHLLDKYYQMCNERFRLMFDNEYDGFHRCYYITLNIKRLANNIPELRSQLRGKVVDRFNETKYFKNMSRGEMEDYIRDTILIKPVDRDYEEAIKEVHAYRKMKKI